MKNHLNFFPEHGVTITLPPNTDDPSTMFAFIPLHADDINYSVVPDYNLVINENVLILRLSFVYDKDKNKDKNMSFCCIKVENAYQNNDIEMIVIQTNLKNTATPPPERTLSPYPKWADNTVIFTLDGKIPKFGSNQEEIPRNPSLRLNAKQKDSCTIPPGGGSI